VSSSYLEGAIGYNIMSTTTQNKHQTSEIDGVCDMLNNMNTADNEDSILSICANCGKEGSDVNNTCNKCKSVKYCNAACKKKHRHKHKKECERRVAELRDERHSSNSLRQTKIVQFVFLDYHNSVQDQCICHVVENLYVEGVFMRFQKETLLLHFVPFAGFLHHLLIQK